MILSSLALVFTATADGTFHSATERPPAKQLAIAQLEALGLDTAPTSFTRMVAISHQPAIDLFLAAGIDINAAGDSGRTALLTAIRVRNWPLAERLIAAGADVKRADAGGLTPLMAAVANGNGPIVEELLIRGAQPHVIDQKGRTALHYAVATRQHQLIDRLVQAGSPSEAIGTEGSDLADVAFETHDPKIIAKILRQLPSRESWSAAACEALGTALEARDLKLATLLISRHTAPPRPTEGAQPFVAYAIARGDRGLLETLLDCGASPDCAMDAPGDEALIALLGENFSRYYLDKEPGFTPLMLAAAMKRVDCVKLLIERGAARTQGTTGRTRLLPLYFAAWAACPEAIQLLLGSTTPSREALRIEVDLSSQRATMLRNGVSVFSTKISSGTSNKPTPKGEFVVTDKDIDHRSSIYDSAPMPFFMRLSCRDFGLHQGYVTGRPASHGCIRLPGDAARKLFKEVPIGTWVSVIN